MQTLMQLNGTVLRVIRYVLSACDLPLSDNAIADNKAAILHKVFAEEHYVIWLF